MQRAAIYIRVSTEEQAEFSPDAQKRALFEYAKRNNYLISADHIFIDEGISGRTAEKRPAFMHMIALARGKPKAFDAILVHKFDRFARNREDSVVYKSLLRKDCGIKVISITEQLEDDKFSIILESMLEAMAEYYSLNLSDEVKKGMFEKARRGEHIGKAPYGYVVEKGKLVKNDYEFAVVQELFDMFIGRNQALTSIVRYCNQNGIKSKTNGNWTPKTISYMLGNPVYCGKVRYNYLPGGKGPVNPPEEWIIADSDHEPAISEETYQKSLDKLARIASMYDRQYDPQQLKSWTQRICKCAKCGGTMTISTTNGGRYKAFRCSNANKGACSMSSTLSVNKIERLVLSQLEKDFQGIDAIEAERVVHKPSQSQADILRVRLKELDDMLALAKKAYLGKVDTLEEYSANKTSILSEKKSLEQSIKKAGEIQSAKIDVYHFKHFYDLLTDHELSIEEKNNAAKQFIKEIRVDLINKRLKIVYYV